MPPDIAAAYAAFLSYAQPSPPCRHELPLHLADDVIDAMPPPISFTPLLLPLIFDY